MEKIYVPSKVDPSLHWSIYVHKPDRGPAYAAAIAGELNQDDGWQSFKFKIDFAARHPATKVEITGPATAKKKLAALEQLQNQMREADLI
jgi:hypothetical protein